MPDPTTFCPGATAARSIPSTHFDEQQAHLRCSASGTGAAHIVQSSLLYFHAVTPKKAFSVPRRRGMLGLNLIDKIEPVRCTILLRRSAFRC